MVAVMVVFHGLQYAFHSSAFIGVDTGGMVDFGFDLAVLQRKIQ